MYAERVLLETDAQGNLVGLPKLPPNQKLEVIFLMAGESTREQGQKNPPSVLKGSVSSEEDWFSSVFSEEELEDSIERTARQIAGDPEAFE